MPVSFNNNKLAFILALLTTVQNSPGHSAIQLQLNGSTTLEIINEADEVLSPGALYASDPEQLATTLFLGQPGEYKTTVEQGEAIPFWWGHSLLTLLKPGQHHADWLFLNGYCQTSRQVRVIPLQSYRYVVVPEDCTDDISETGLVWTIIRVSLTAAIPDTAKSGNAVSPAVHPFGTDPKNSLRKPYPALFSDLDIAFPDHLQKVTPLYLDAIAQHQRRQVLSINYHNYPITGGSKKSAGAELLNELIANARSLDEIAWLMKRLSGNNYIATEDELKTGQYMANGKIKVQKVLIDIKKAREINDLDNSDASIRASYQAIEKAHSASFRSAAKEPVVKAKKEKTKTRTGPGTTTHTASGASPGATSGSPPDGASFPPLPAPLSTDSDAFLEELAEALAAHHDNNIHEITSSLNSLTSLSFPYIRREIKGQDRKLDMRKLKAFLQGNRGNLKHLKEHVYYWLRPYSKLSILLISYQLVTQREAAHILSGTNKRPTSRPKTRRSSEGPLAQDWKRK